MKISVFISSLLLITNLTHGQVESRTFLSEGRTFDTLKKYYINEITIFSDSTYVQKFFKLENKRQRNNYSSFDYDLTNGKFKKRRDLYIFSQIGRDSIFDNYFKIKKEKLTYYYQLENGKLKKGTVFKEVESIQPNPIDYIREISDYVYFRNIDKDLVSESKTTEIKYGDYLSGKTGLKITEYFYSDTKELIRLKIASEDYPEYVDNYYFKNGELVLAENWINNENSLGKRVKLFVRNGKVLNKPKTEKEIIQKIIATGKNYMADYKKDSL